MTGRLSRRQANSIGLGACAAMMGFALYAQYVLRLAPCNMCILQRICVIALGAAFLLAALHDPRDAGARLYAFLIGLCAAVGAAVAGRHVWMQMQPFGSLPSCGADFYSMLDMMPVHQAVLRVLSGGGDCQAITWSLFGLSMPAWVVVALTLVGSGGVAANCRLARALTRANTARPA